MHERNSSSSSSSSDNSLKTVAQPYGAILKYNWRCAIKNRFATWRKWWHFPFCWIVIESWRGDTNRSVCVWAQGNRNRNGSNRRQNCTNSQNEPNDHSRGFDDAIVVLRILTFYFVVDSWQSETGYERHIYAIHSIHIFENIKVQMDWWSIESCRNNFVHTRWRYRYWVSL